MAEKYLGYLQFEQSCYASIETMINKVLLEKFHVPVFKNDSLLSSMISILDGRSDVCISTTTDNIRSLCYLVPALIRSPQVTFVFCPSVRRIKGRVQRLQELNIPSVTIHSGMPLKQQIKTVDEYLLDYQKAMLIYMTPDQVLCEHFKKLLAFLKSSKALAYLVLDLSYNENQWHTDNKTMTLELSKLRFAPVQWILVTVTDVPEVLNGLKAVLNFRAFASDFDPAKEIYRRDIFYDVITYNSSENIYENLKGFINQSLDDNSCNFLLSIRPRGLIFCRTGMQANQLATDLNKMGVAIASFHPGLEHPKQADVLKQFYMGDLQLLAITSSAANQINISRLRLVIHWGLPTTLLAYISEAGRVKGHYGTLARCRIYVTNEALSYYNEERESDLKSYLEDDSEEKSEKAKMRYDLYCNTSKVKDYCVHNNCRHKFLLSSINQNILCCEDRCDYCKSQKDNFENARLSITKEIESEGVSKYINKFKDQIKYNIREGSDHDGQMHAIRSFDELFRITAVRCLTNEHHPPYIRDRKLVQNLFEEVFPQHARRLYENRKLSVLKGCGIFGPNK